MMMLAGACRSQIGAARLDGLVTTYDGSDDPRVRSYYRSSFDTGLNDTELGLTLAQCNRAISGLERTIAEAG
jgi:hypothetical protein